MSHGITTIDRGVVWGNTWHRRPEYIRQDAAVTIEQVLEVFDYPMEIRCSYGKTQRENGVKVSYEIPGSNHIVRTDTGTLIAPMVGDRFTLMDNSNFVNWINDSILIPYPDLQIESCGTLYSGSAQFISIVADRYQVKGDESETLQRILWTHHIGLSAYNQNINEVRTLCDNTRRYALESGEMLTKVSHTSAANERVKAEVLKLAELKTKFSVEREKMNYLAGTEITEAEVDAVLEFIFSTLDASGEPKEGRGATIAKNKHKKVKDIFEGGQDGFMAGYDRSAYAFLNAITDFLGNENGRGKTDVGFDNVAGNRASIKDKALDSLLEVVK